MIKFCCEIGSNFNGSIDRIYQLIEAAKSVGSWSVKFQLFEADKLYHPAFKKHIQTTKQRELPVKFLPMIKKKCEELDLKFICTPFHIEGVKILIDNGVDYLKVSSFNILDDPLIMTVQNTHIPWMISAGMGSLKGLEKNVNFLYNPPSVIFHCNSNYPAKPEDCNLSDLLATRLRSFFQGKFGWSDHTVCPGVIYQAIGFGASFIEFHFDLGDMEGAESIYGHCWRPDQMKSVIKTVRVMESSIISTDTHEEESTKWRTDPVDGMRPLKEFREELLGGEV